MTRPDGRHPNELRPLTFERDYTEMAAGSVLVSFGRTRVLCTASIDEDVPRWMKGSGKGWVTAEYSMLPGSSPERIRRRVSGRDQEIQRLIGRALRSCVDRKKLGERTITLDCDVIQADGGTRTAAITGSWVALFDCLKWMEQRSMFKTWPLKDHVAAISCGIHNGTPVLDLDYPEDSSAGTDANFVMTGSGGIVEIQGTAEGEPFSEATLGELLALAKKGIGELVAKQKAAIA